MVAEQETVYRLGVAQTRTCCIGRSPEPRCRSALRGTCGGSVVRRVENGYRTCRRRGCGLTLRRWRPRTRPMDTTWKTGRSRRTASGAVIAAHAPASPCPSPECGSCQRAAPGQRGRRGCTCITRRAGRPQASWSLKRARAPFFLSTASEGGDRVGISTLCSGWPSMLATRLLGGRTLSLSRQRRYTVARSRRSGPSKGWKRSTRCRRASRAPFSCLCFVTARRSCGWY
jgi:hypothetical protein